MRLLIQPGGVTASRGPGQRPAQCICGLLRQQGPEAIETVLIRQRCAQNSRAQPKLRGAGFEALTGCTFVPGTAGWSAEVAQRLKLWPVARRHIAARIHDIWPVAASSQGKAAKYDKKSRRLHEDNVTSAPRNRKGRAITN
jgi:hypothetical protein